MSTAVEQILELARWAPSGDNTQVWRFELLGPDSLAVHCHDTRADCVYDLDGHPSQLSHGVLLETIAIAASAHGLRADCLRRAGSADTHPVYDVRLSADQAVVPSPLLDVIASRSVQRRPMSTRALTGTEKQALEAAAGSAYDVMWIEGFGPKLRAARLMFDNAKLRLTMPEAYEVHRRVIEWNKSESSDRIPDQALGVDNATLRLMKWAMVSWDRLATMNKLMGTWAPRLQMDLVPGLACAAHFVLKARRQPQGIDDYVEAGRAVQRFWLTVAKLGLQLQPEMTPLIFSGYVRNNIRFTRIDKLQRSATGLLGKLDAVIGSGAGYPVFMGRVGAGPAARARSTRKTLAQLIK
ncbi:MAG: molybdopterin biosynthesis protein MoeY [Massilia sp.]|nr:molybdopterin biosynthesis protein MoeY [Massilia sp.]